MPWWGDTTFLVEGAVAVLVAGALLVDTGDGVDGCVEGGPWVAVVKVDDIDVVVEVVGVLVVDVNEVAVDTGRG